GFPGATPAISANGLSNGIVWAIQSDAFGVNGPQVLHAYDATDVSHELYNSSQAGSRDDPGPAVKFAVPAGANGKVFVGAQHAVTVFGLLGPFPAPAGIYQGLFFDTNGVAHDSSGLLTVTVGKNGSFTGKILSGAQKLSFSGKFPASGNWST